MPTFFHRDFLCIGHRGFPRAAPENTLRGFELAISAGVDALELDVQWVDGGLIVFHDDELDRTTSGTGRVDAARLAHLRSLDAGEGERIPLLAEVLDQVAGRVPVNIELKGPGSAGPTIDLLRARTEPAAGILLSAFDHRELKVARAAAPEYPRAALFGRLDRDPVATAKELAAVAVNVHRRSAKRALVKAARSAGMATLVYTVNDPEEALALRRIGVAGIFTDCPDLMLATAELR
jgi:glycerophosphoryl diester phosphodiesterase